MVVVKASAVASFTRVPPSDTKAVLVYGPDAGRVREIAAAVVIAVAGSPDDPFLVTRLSDDKLVSDPALLADEARSLPFGQGRRVVWVAPAGRGFQEAIELYFADPGGDALVVAEAGLLPKSSRLRAVFESGGQAALIACYEDSAEDLRNLATASAAEAGLAISPDVLNYLVDRTGSDRALSRREIEKLLLYCHGRACIDLADVEAVCGDVSASSLDSLVDAVFEGDTAEACRRMAQLGEAGLPAASMLSGIGQHLVRLQEFRTEIDRGRTGEAVVRAARPPILFKRQPHILRQLAIWPARTLDEAMRTALDATTQTRRFPSLEQSIAERAVLALARRSRALRSKAA